MAEQTLGQTLDSLVFRMGRIENWIAKWTKLQQLRINGAKELLAELFDLGNAILNPRVFPDPKIEKVFVPLQAYQSILADKITPKTRIHPPISVLPVECPACHMRFKTKLGLKAHIVNDANHGRRKFRVLHKDARQKQVWRNA